MKRLLILTLLIASVGIFGGFSMEKQREMEEMQYTVVSVECAKGTGSGVVISSGNGVATILTAKHVVKKCEKVNITLYPQEISVPAKVVAKSKEHDLALIVMPMEWQHTAQLGNKNPRMYEETWKIGCGLGIDPHPSQGIVSATDDYQFMTTAHIMIGDSGGGIFTKRKGRYVLVGIVESVAFMPPNIPINHIGFAQNLTAIHGFLMEVFDGKTN